MVADPCCDGRCCDRGGTYCAGHSGQRFSLKEELYNSIKGGDSVGLLNVSLFLLIDQIKYGGKENE
jgi:hypothetical protein